MIIRHILGKKKFVYTSRRKSCIFKNVFSIVKKVLIDKALFIEIEKEIN